MAVQAQYTSYAFSPDLCSRVKAGSVLEGLQMWQNRENQSEQLLPSMVLIDDGEQQPAATTNVTTSRDHSHIEPVYNVSGSGRWSRDGSLSSIAAAATALPHQPGVPNPVYLAVPSLPSAVRFPMSIDQRHLMFESATASTSGRMENVSIQSVPVGPSLPQELLALMCNHNVELDTILNNYKNMLREGIRETQKKHWKSMVAMLEQKALKRLREKDEELENAKRRNTELEQKIIQLCSKNQIFFNLARHNEALVTSLKATLDQVQNSTAEPAAIEGYGDTDGTQFPANGEQFLVENPNVGIACKLCQEKNFSVVILPCRHLCLCKECDTTVAMCPICNTPKKGSIQIFLP